MNRKKHSLALLLPFLLLSCQKKPASLPTVLSPTTEAPSSFARSEDCEVTTFSVEPIGMAEGSIRVVRDPDDSGTILLLNPFNTAITGSLYSVKGVYSSEVKKEMQSFFSDRLMTLHALTDRHHSYVRAEKKEDGSVVTTPIVNLRDLNESYGTEKPVVLEEPLYSYLKKAYSFSLETDGLYDIFVGELSSYYEQWIPRNASYLTKNALDQAYSLSANVLIGQDVDSATIEKIVKETPKTRKEMEGLLTFDDESRSVTFHAYSGAEAEGGKVSITLGGCAKGMAVETVADEFAERYPGASLLINGGSSSIKCTAFRPDGTPWNIRIVSPAYREKIAPSEEKEPLNPYEVALSVYGPFNLSTSGYYEQYFYALQDDGTFVRRDHILLPSTGVSASLFDAVSVFLDDAGTADLYSTALMNARSLEEAKSLFQGFSSSRPDELCGVLLAAKGEKGASSFTPYVYKRSDLSPLSSLSLPITNVLSNDGRSVKEYEGDYQDVAAGLLRRGRTKADFSFEEDYFYSSALEGRLSLLDGKDLDNPENVLAVLKPLS